MPGKILNRVVLERMKEAVDPMLRDQQAGFWRNKSCADQIASLHIIVEQSPEWNSHPPPLYQIHRLWKGLWQCRQGDNVEATERHYGVPKKIISLIQCTYQDMSCRIAHTSQLSESFKVKTGVRQGCLFSLFLFLLVIDWIIKITATGRNNGIQWTHWTQLDDLNFADELALLSHNHSQMQDNFPGDHISRNRAQDQRKKTELMKMNTTANTPVTVGGEPISEVESFVYLGSEVDQQGGTDRDVTARAAFVMLKNIWASPGGSSMRTVLCIFNSNVKSILLYRCETWWPTQTMQQKIQTFFNTCLRSIYKKSIGRRRSEMKTCGSERDRNQWPADTAEEVGLDRTHPQEASIQHHMPSPDLEPAGKVEERLALQQLEVRHWNRAETARDQLDWHGQISPEQSAMVRVCRCLCSTWSDGHK